MVVELLRSGEAVQLSTRGRSMWPLIPSHSRVEVQPCSASELAVGEIAAFESRGRVIVHRVHHVGPRGVFFAGDSQAGEDGSIPRERVLGRVRILRRRSLRWRLPTRDDATRLKRTLRRTLTYSPLRHLAGPLYAGMTQAELLLVRALESAGPEPALDARRCQRVTALIKTFERPRALERLVASLRARYPELPIIVADDSREPSAPPGVELIALPFDSGVSLGRQAALERARTEYVWLLDDDFVLFHGTCLAPVLDALERHPEVDLIGGHVINLPLWRKSRSKPNGIYRTPASPVLPHGAYASGLEICDKVPNFYVARTEQLKRVGWTPELKRLDHADFFTRAKGILAIAYLDQFRCLHAQTPFDRNYMRHRLDCAEDRRILASRYRPSGASGPRSKLRAI
jgi:hypothetical protein